MTEFLEDLADFDNSRRICASFLEGLFESQSLVSKQWLVTLFDRAKQRREEMISTGGEPSRLCQVFQEIDSDGVKIRTALDHVMQSLDDEASPEGVYFSECRAR